MDDIVSSPPETNIRKRPAPEEDRPDCQKPLNLKGNQFIMPTPPDTEESSNASPDASINNDDKERAASPAPSSVLSSVMEVTPSNTDAAASSSIDAVPGTFTAKAPNSTSGPPPAKRRKLTPSEKLEAAQLKEAKAREKAEQKALKEEEKARKDEEKARKEEEKAKLQVLKDEDKRLKDEEKRQKAEERVRLEEIQHTERSISALGSGSMIHGEDSLPRNLRETVLTLRSSQEAKKREKELAEQRKIEDKLQKERKQMRLGAFFQGPATPAKQNDNEGQSGGLGTHGVPCLAATSTGD